jgi:hypothetical protein
MKSILRVVLWLVPAALAIIGTPAFACSYPPAESIAQTWPPSSRVQVIPDAQVNTFSAITNAVNNWNSATQLYCYAPVFTFGAGTGQTMTVAYGPIAKNPNGNVRRGLTVIHFSTRISSAQTTLNSNIPLTFPNVMTEVMAHEMGHTMGLNDCIYSPACPIYSSVMEDQAPIPQWTGQEGQPGPTVCDIAIMTAVATDYPCPPPPQSTCPSPQGQPPAGCSNPVWNTANCTWTCTGSPIIIDISGQGFSLTNAANGVSFDISGTGHPIQMGWTAGANNAFLALPGADGLVHNGKQLFGNFTPQPQSSTPNGFAALAVYDDPRNGGNGDGVIDAKDAVFSSLRLWVDSNHDGISQPEELYTLPSLGVNSISLNYHADERTDQWGNVFHYHAQVNPGDPASVGRQAYDVFFVGLGPNRSAGNTPKCQVPTKKVGMLEPVSSSLR